MVTKKSLLNDGVYMKIDDNAFLVEVLGFGGDR